MFSICPDDFDENTLAIDHLKGRGTIPLRQYQLWSASEIQWVQRIALFPRLIISVSNPRNEAFHWLPLPRITSPSHSSLSIFSLLWAHSITSLLFGSCWWGWWTSCQLQSKLKPHCLWSNCGSLLSAVAVARVGFLFIYCITPILDPGQRDKNIFLLELIREMRKDNN